MTAAAVLALAGCSESVGDCDDMPAPTRSAGKQLPVRISLPSDPPSAGSGLEVEAALPPEKERPDLFDQVMRQLMTDTIDMAGVIGDVRPGECEQEKKGKGAYYRCTVFYEGLKAEWKVQFSDIDASGGWSTSRYRAWPAKGVLTAKTVYAAYGWTRKDEKEVPPRCDKMPKVFLAEAGKALRYECQSISYRCHNGDWRLRWANDPIWIDDDGRVDFGEPDPGFGEPDPGFGDPDSG
ncbi:hypothetical protein DVA86_16255 [Streptomyces armeniacus]|uniref:Uncharacterized protein n=2 Tax=Streptomyces armeniacus TaxID=83291 RepID=A0A345XQR4_9ACTN|nr:hypothetical protein DVA86_16255 [Streptomyces armeniacus]